MSRRRKSAEYAEFWPGYVDMLSTLLMVFMFLLTIFMVAQYHVARQASGKDDALRRLTRQITELTSLFALEKGRATSAANDLAALQATLVSLRAENARISSFALDGDEKSRAAQSRLSGLSAELDEHKKLSSEAAAKVDLLNQQLLALRRQLAVLNEALEASDK